MAEILHQLRLVVYPIIYMVYTSQLHPRWCRISVINSSSNYWQVTSCQHPKSHWTLWFEGIDSVIGNLQCSDISKSPVWDPMILRVYVIHLGPWFQRIFIFTPIWGSCPIWLVFFRWVVQPPTRYIHVALFDLFLLTPFVGFHLKPSTFIWNLRFKNMICSALIFPAWDACPVVYLGKR